MWQKRALLKIHALPKRGGQSSFADFKIHVVQNPPKSDSSLPKVIIWLEVPSVKTYSCVVLLTQSCILLIEFTPKAPFTHFRYNQRWESDSDANSGILPIIMWNGRRLIAEIASLKKEGSQSHQQVCQAVLTPKGPPTFRRDVKHLGVGETSSSNNNISVNKLRP